LDSLGAEKPNRRSNDQIKGQQESMGKGRKQKTQKMKNRKRQSKKKSRLKKRAEAVKKSRSA
jgi:hypothetical protein